MDEKLIKLIGKLIQKTNDDKITWSDTSGPSEYVANFNSGAIVISSFEESLVDINSFGDEDYLNFHIYNEDGQKIVGLSFSSNSNEYKILKDLYFTIERKFTKFDETIDGIFKELE